MLENRNGKWLFLILVAVLLAGCSFGSSGVERRLNVTWVFRPGGVSTASMGSLGGVEVSEKNYGYVGGAAEIRADISGDTSGEFVFEASTESPTERISNNIFQIQAENPEKGSVHVSCEGLETIVDYEIYPSGILFSLLSDLNVPVGFNFDTGEKETNYTSSMYVYGRDLSRPVIHGRLAEVDNEGDFWGAFPELNNLHEYEYTEQSIRVSFSKIYLVQVVEDDVAKGYAAVRFTDDGGSFVYKYSETGIFD